MAKNKGPFKSYSIEDVKEAESNSFVIQFGQDFFSEDGDFVFTAPQAEKHYNKLLTNIIKMLNEGTEKQRRHALNCLARLEVRPLRIQ